MIKDVCEVSECPDCASGNIVCNADRQQLICRECGLIFEPLTPVDEAAFERSHDLGSVAKPVRAKPKAAAKKRK